MSLHHDRLDTLTNITHNNNMKHTLRIVTIALIALATATPAQAAWSHKGSSSSHSGISGYGHKGTSGGHAGTGSRRHH